MADLIHAQTQIKPDQIMDIIIRRRWLILIPVFISLTVGLLITLTASKTYQASTLILVQPQRIPDNYVRSVVTSTINQRISTISQQILSRSNLEKIIDQFGLYEDAPGMYLEDKIESMRKRVKVKIELARQGAEAFSIVFNGSDPQRVMRVANTLATYFMDENLKVREAQAVGTSEFLESELEKTRKTLAEYEKNISEYRARYLGGLPDELESNLRTLDRLQEQLSAKQTLLQDLRNSQNLLKAQIAQSKEIENQELMDASSFYDFEEEMDIETENETKLKIAQEAYNDLISKYTEKHPDVIKALKSVNNLKKVIEDEKIKNENEALEESYQQDTATDSIDNDTDNEDQTLTSFDVNNFSAMQQELQLQQMQDEIQKVQAEINVIESKMERYQQRVEDTPKREQELQALQRDYTNIKAIFSSLLDRKLEAELSVNMEKKQKGEQFRILDHARLPEKPISPDVKKLFLFSMVAGFGISGGLIFLLEFLNQSIRRDEQIENDLGLVILARIPPLIKSSDRLKKRLEIIAFAGCTIYTAFLLLCFAVLNFKGLDRTIHFIKQYFPFYT